MPNRGSKGVQTITVGRGLGFPAADQSKPWNVIMIGLQQAFSYLCADTCSYVPWST